MKIALVTYDFYPNKGGISYTLTNLCKFLNSSMNKTIYVFNNTYQGKNSFKVLTEKEYNLKFIFSNLVKKKFLYFSLLIFWRIIKDKKIPLSHKIKMLLYLVLRPYQSIWVIQNIKRLYPHLKRLNCFLFIAGTSRWTLLLAFFLSKIFKKKTVVFAHGSDFLKENTLKLKSFYLRNVDKILIHTDQIKRLIKNIHGVKEEQLVKVRPGLDVDKLKVQKSKIELRKEYRIPENQFILISVGHHNPRKKFDLVIRAVSEIKRIRPSINLKYFILGEGKETPKLKQLSKSLKIEDLVEFVGECSDEIRNKYYKLSDLFLMPSITKKNNIEGFGVVYLEANYFKLPVISTGMGGVSEAVIDGKTGLFTKPNSVKDIADKVLYLYNNKEKQKELGEFGFNRVHSSFKWDIVIKDYIEVFKDLL